jgi:hypothetical protein
MSQQMLDFGVSASFAMLFAYGLFRLFVGRENYFAWIMPLFLVGIFAGMFATSGSGSPPALGAFAGVLAGGVVLGRRSWHLHRAHQNRLSEFARELGLSFSRNDNTYANEAGLLVDDIGSCFNVMQGKWQGVPVALFDYQYLDMSDLEAPALIALTFAVSVLDEAQPRMIIREHGFKELLKHRLGSKTGLLGDEEFDFQFRVATADVERAKAILRPRTREWLLANARGAKVLIDGTTLMLCVGHQTMKQLPDLLDRIRALRATFA